MRKELGALLTVGGVVLVWLLQKHLYRRRVHDRPTVQERFITLTSKGDRCGIEEKQENIRKVVLRRTRGDQVHWIIKNPKGSGSKCDRDVRVCIGLWERDGSRTESPVVDLQKQELCRTVPQPSTEPICAQVDPKAPYGVYSYSVLIDGDVAIDPMVQIVE